MAHDISRQLSIALAALVGGLVLALSSAPAFAESSEEWADWKRYRGLIAHPWGLIDSNDLKRASQNLERHGWAKEYLEKLERDGEFWIGKITRAWLEEMVPETTPGDTLYTPCPECRELGKPYLPHGDWIWKATEPNVLTCKVCKMEYPNKKHPENVVVRSTWGKPQEFTFVGGEPFRIFTYHFGRPSMTGNIRAQKVILVTTVLDQFTELYALTGETRYADAVRKILLRLSVVYPNWLVHTGYGDYADVAPAVAAKQITTLPSPVLSYPPNKPTHTLHRGFWSAGRARGVGMEGPWLITIAKAYDLTCTARKGEAPLYSEDEKVQIERDLLLEGTRLLIADTEINNKAVGNRAAVAIVGKILGEPQMVRFGIDGFNRMLKEWFLPDGGTPESPAYALMTLQGFSLFSQAFRDYSDPAGYRAEDGSRIDHYNVYQDPAYQRVWAAIFNTLQGDLFYPPFANSYKTTNLSVGMVELMASNYPEESNYQALAREVLGGDWSKPYAPFATFWANPERNTLDVGRLSFTSFCLPDLKIGYMRSGAEGRDSLLLLSASDYKTVHHHCDGLNLVYWKNGVEWLSDLGYLWDHPDGGKLSRTFAHNTVLIDEKDQQRTGRVGMVHYFLNDGPVKAMAATASAYPNAEMYERSTVYIDHQKGRSYGVDLFSVKGGAVQDYVYHGAAEVHRVLEYAAPREEKAEGFVARLLRHFRGHQQRRAEWRSVETETHDALYDLEEVVQLKKPMGPVVLEWEVDGQGFRFWNFLRPEESMLIGKGWGQRSSRNQDRGATLPYIVRRTQGEGLKKFTSVFEAYQKGMPTVQGVVALPIEEEGAEALVIETGFSRDYVVIRQKSGPIEIKTAEGLLTTDSRLAVISVTDEGVLFKAAQDGSVELK